jgi:hypothetical protein
MGHSSGTLEVDCSERKIHCSYHSAHCFRVSAEYVLSVFGNSMQLFVFYYNIERERLSETAVYMWTLIYLFSLICHFLHCTLCDMSHTEKKAIKRTEKDW